jgi:predicted component of type VI protein secretion system
MVATWIGLPWYWRGELPLTGGTPFQRAGKDFNIEQSIVKQCITALVGTKHDDFKLLRDIMGKAIPVFCPYISSNPPSWRKYKDVSQMTKMWKLHFHLQRKTGSITSPTQQSLQFLQSLAEPSISANITSI